MFVNPLFIAMLVAVVVTFAFAAKALARCVRLRAWSTLGLWAAGGLAGPPVVCLALLALTGKPIQAPTVATGAALLGVPANFLLVMLWVDGRLNRLAHPATSVEDLRKRKRKRAWAKTERQGDAGPPGDATGDATGNDGERARSDGEG